ncbi:glycosyltransferase [Mycobacterium phage JuicyJay]|nr:hypothetical protein SEA_KLEIN_23 [Mycobacterium phage Klein]AYB69512.1 glycosyltransferase [Mycobacterium phage Kalah2]UEM46514.1 glycosyltransferase [Mycobacterium phage JuicyJay]
MTRKGNCVRVIAMVSWYEENPAWLAECVSSISKLADHVVAVDGAYWGFPNAVLKPASGSEQADVIARTAAGLGMGTTIHVPRKPWSGPHGGEVAKRNFMMQLAMMVAEPGDWLLRIDADEVLSDVPLDAHQRLAETSASVAEVTLWEREASDHIGETVDTLGDYQQPFRCLFRATPGIDIRGNHYTVTAPVDGERRVLNGMGQIPAEQLLDLRLEHRTRLRTKARQRLKAEYSSLINTFETVLENPCEE